MSPTATIVTVILALLLCAWIFRTTEKDPGYEAWLKRQQQQRAAAATPEAAGAAVTDPGVAKDLSKIGERQDPAGDLGPGAAPADSELDPLLAATLRPAAPPGEADVLPAGEFAEPTTRPIIRLDARLAFRSGQRLDGTFVGVAYIGDAPQADAPDVPSITFRRNGTFSTVNMAQAEVDMEASSSSSLDRGSGTYKLGGNSLVLVYNDGQVRRKGNTRTYVAVPAAGPTHSPTAISIQGKIFKLAEGR